MNGDHREDEFSIGDAAQQEYVEEQNSWIPVWDFHFENNLSIEEGASLFSCYNDEQLKEIKVKSIQTGNDLIHENVKDCELGVLRGTLKDGTLITRANADYGPIGYAYFLDMKGHDDIVISDQTRKCLRMELSPGDIIIMKKGHHVAFVVTEEIESMILAKAPHTATRNTPMHDNDRDDKIQIFETTTED